VVKRLKSRVVVISPVDGSRKGPLTTLGSPASRSECADSCSDHWSNRWPWPSLPVCVCYSLLRTSSSTHSTRKSAVSTLLHQKERSRSGLLFFFLLAVLFAVRRSSRPPIGTGPVRYFCFFSDFVIRFVAATTRLQLHSKTPTGRYCTAHLHSESRGGTYFPLFVNLCLEAGHIHSERHGNPTYLSSKRSHQPMFCSPSSDPLFHSPKICITCRRR
jgi:hypothetical protein